MNDTEYNKLLEKLGKYIDDDRVDLSVSPTLGSDCGKAATSVPLFITRDMDVDQLTESQIYLTHTLLHKFYARGGTKDLDKIDIEKLHNLIKVKMSHSDFDNLDKK